MEQMMESSSDEKTISLKDSILTKYDQVFHAHTADIKRVNDKITAECKNFIQYYEDSCLQMEAITKSLQQRESELKKKEDKLLKEKRKLQLKNTVEDRMLHCKQAVNKCYSLRKLADAQNGELDMLRKRRAELEDQLKPESYESLQREIMQLQVCLQVIQEDDCVDFQEKLKNLERELKEKNEELQELKDRTNTYRLAIHGKDIELEDARWELLDGLKTSPIVDGIGIKIMGLVDSRPFFVGCHSSEKRKEISTKFASLCKNLGDNPNWHPFKAITDGSGKKEIIDEEDEKMVILKSECSKEQYGAVVTALMERNRYHKSGREMWNYKEKREASLCEGIDYILKEWKIHRKRH